MSFQHRFGQQPFSNHSIITLNTKRVVNLSTSFTSCGPRFAPHSDPRGHIFHLMWTQVRIPLRPKRTHLSPHVDPGSHPTQTQEDTSVTSCGPRFASHSDPRGHIFHLMWTQVRIPLRPKRTHLSPHVDPGSHPTQTQEDTSFTSCGPRFASHSDPRGHIFHLMWTQVRIPLRPKRTHLAPHVDPGSHPTQTQEDTSCTSCGPRFASHSDPRGHILHLMWTQVRIPLRPKRTHLSPHVDPGSHPTQTQEDTSFTSCGPRFASHSDPRGHICHLMWTQVRIPLRPDRTRGLGFQSLHDRVGFSKNNNSLGIFLPLLKT